MFEVKSEGQFLREGLPRHAKIFGDEELRPPSTPILKNGNSNS